MGNRDRNPRPLRPVTQAELQAVVIGFITYLEATFGKDKVGFTLFAFAFGDGGPLAYVSNTEREQMIATMKEWLARLEAGLSSDPLGPRAES